MPSAKKNAKKTRKKKKATLSQIGVNFARKEKIEEFIQDNISQINNNIGSFDKESCKKAKLQFDATDIKNELHRQFIKAIKATENKTLIHSIGNNDERKTILTEKEFIYCFFMIFILRSPRMITFISDASKTPNKKLNPKIIVESDGIIYASNTIIP